jgi:DNA repair photolyase
MSVGMLFVDSPQPRLIGIARLAAASPLLDAKRRVEYFQLPARRFITRCSSKRVPFEWTINPYRGCEFGCKYCYARYTHEFMELRDSEEFEEKIYAKLWNPAAFREELRKIDRRQSIAIGTATDPYQPAERRYRVTRAMLKVFAGERGRKLSIVTKSDLVVRDIDLLKAIARANVLYVNLTVTTLDEELARLLEPRAPRPALRIGAVRKLAEAGVKTGVLSNPVLPLLNDSEASLDAVAAAAAGAGAAWWGAGVVFLKPSAQKVFFPFLEDHFPHLVRRYRERFEKSAFLKGRYPAMIQERVRAIRARHGLAQRFPEYRPELWEDDPQIELAFDQSLNFVTKSTCRSCHDAV